MVMGDMEMRVDLAILGAGPAGLAAALRAASLGIDTALIDRNEHVGGHYLHRRGMVHRLLGDIAADMQALVRLRELGLSETSRGLDLEQVQQQLQETIHRTGASLTELCRKKGILPVHGKAVFESPDSLRIENGQISRIRFHKAIITTGRSYEPPPESQDSDLIITPDDIRAIKQIPEQLLVSATGRTAIELAVRFSMFGSDVHLICENRKLIREVDNDLLQYFTAALRGRIIVDTNTRIETFSTKDNKVDVQMERAEEPLSRRYDLVIWDTGLLPATQSLGLKHAGIIPAADGSLTTDEQQRTHIDNIFAAGAVTGHDDFPGLALREGIVAAECVADMISAVDIRALPVVLGVDPQIGWCGLTEKKADGTNTAVRIEYIEANDWTPLLAGKDLHRIKLLCEPDTGRILGFGVAGRGIEPLLAELSLAIETGCLAEDLALTLHPLPSHTGLLPELAALFTPFSLFGRLSGTGA